ncbi:hypothetical protein NL676_024438 [Syzygium grande]|nr:hypothetical protein NL676_024438 [Syzygium grande]
MINKGGSTCSSRGASADQLWRNWSKGPAAIGAEQVEEVEDEFLAAFGLAGAEQEENLFLEWRGASRIAGGRSSNEPAAEQVEEVQDEFLASFGLAGAEQEENLFPKLLAAIEFDVLAGEGPIEQ